MDLEADIVHRLEPALHTAEHTLFDGVVLAETPDFDQGLGPLAHAGALSSVLMLPSSSWIESLWRKHRT